MSVDDAVRERYEAIVLARRVKALVMGTGLLVLAGVFYYALTSIGFFAANIHTYFPNFVNALRDFFPFLAPSFPFIDPTGFLDYWAFISERNMTCRRPGLLASQPSRMRLTC